MLQRKYRLSAKQFSTVYQRGKKLRGELGMFVVLESNTVENPQFGFVVSKKVGNAVERHRVTRLLHEITQELIKEYNLDNYKYMCQYIAFKYTDSYKDIYSEYSKQILKGFNVNEKDRASSNKTVSKDPLI